MHFRLGREGQLKLGSNATTGLCSANSSHAPAAAAAAQASAPAAQPSSVQQLKDLASLKAQGVLTDQEVAEAKARILSA